MTQHAEKGGGGGGVSIIAWMDGCKDSGKEEEEEEAVSSCLEFPAGNLNIKKYFRQNMRNKWHNIKIIFIEIITSKMDF